MIIKYILEMQTPKRLSRFKRIPPTAETEKLDLNRTNLKESSIRKEEERQNYALIKSFCRKPLMEQDYRQRLQTEVAPNKSVMQKNDRKNILKYLDNKFAQFSDLKTWKAAKKQQNQKPAAKLSDKSKQNISFLFREYMSAIRLLKIQTMNEYNLGNVLKQMKFVKNMLNQRDTITKLWLELQKPNFFEVFIFLTHLYLHLQQSRQRGFNSYKGQYLNLMKNLFEEEGQRYSLIDLARIYQSTEIISNNHEYKGFVVNRQNRDTLNSFRRSISRNKL